MANVVKPQVDAAVCAGHGRCYELAPGVFGEDERGHCVLLAGEVPPELQKDALRAEANCPEGAIRIER
jgi:ferredoxin